jgi:dihydrofolate reductase
MIENTPVVIVAGMGKETRAIGKDNQILYHVPADLKRFKNLSMGHPVIMGRKTFESIVAILGKPLPGRTNIVVTRNPNYHYEGAVTTTSLEAAFAEARKENPTEIHIGGGAELYQQALPYVDRLHLTFFYDDTEGDTHFPAFENEFTVVADYPFEEYKGIKFQWVDYERKRS